MSYTINSTLYSFSKLAERGGLAYEAAKRHLSGRVDELFWYLTYPEILNDFRLEHSQSYIEPAIDVYWSTSTAVGFLEVPLEMSNRWAEEDGYECTRIPLGQFYGMNGWAHRIGGEMYYWIPEADGEALDSMLKSYISDLVEAVCEAYDAATSEAALAEFAEDQNMLFDEAGGVWGTTEDLH